MSTKRTLWALALVLFAMVPRANAQIVWTNSSTSSQWQTASNWSGNSVPTATSIAQFGANPTGTGGVGIDYATTTNAGVQVNGQRIQEVGAVEVTSARAHSFLIGNSSTTTGANGQFRLNGSTVNGVANTILRNGSSHSLMIQDRQGSGSQSMALLLGNSTANVVNLDGTGNIVISSNITQSGSTRSLSVNTSGSGRVIMSGTNTFTGGINVTGVTTGGGLQINTLGSLPGTGDISIATGGRLTLNVAGAIGTSGQSLILNPNQTSSPTLRLQTDGHASWQGAVVINAASRVHTGENNSLTFSGNVSGSGTLIKGNPGNLILSGTGNLHLGDTRVEGGTLTVSSGSSLGTGALTLFQTATNSTTVSFNNASQTIGNLSSQFDATTGTITQAVNLNGTALTINQSVDGTFGIGSVATLTSVIAGTGSVTKQGAATLTVSGANTYSGGTTVSGGVLNITNTTGSGTGTGNVTVSGGSLAGNGIISGATTVETGGTLEAGNGAFGTLTINNAVYVQNGGTLRSQAGVGAGTSDTINVSGSGGALTLASGSNLVIAGDGTSYAGLPSYTIANLGSNSLTFGTYNGGVGDIATYTANGSYTTNGVNVTISGFTFSSGDQLVLRRASNSLALTFTPVPEPGPMLLSGGLLAGAVVGLRKIRRAKVTGITPAA
jgi:autotransporter-associated beta strand protein